MSERPPPNPPRLPDTGKYWIRNARVDVADLAESEEEVRGAADADGRVSVDLRIEGGCIRAVLKAGGAPCCGPGFAVEGEAVWPDRAMGGRIGAGLVADLIVSLPGGGTLVLHEGCPAEGPMAASACWGGECGCGSA